MEFIDRVFLPLNEIIMRFDFSIRLGILLLIIVSIGMLFNKAADYKKRKFAKYIQSQGQKQLVNHFVKEIVR